MPTAFIFDLDGTILNTLDDIGNACNYALKKFGYDQHPLKAYEQMVGNGFIILVIRALPEGEYEKLDKTQFELILTEAQTYYSQHMCELTQPYPGIIEALSVLADKHHKLNVLSNKPEHLTQNLIKHYFPFIPFEYVLGGRKDQPLKPDPSRALQLLKDLKCEPATSFLVGDSNVDMQTALAAKMIPIGVAWGFRGAKELDQAGATKLLTQAAEIDELA